MGRPDKLTPERAARILYLVSAGVTIDTACGAVGIDDSAYFRWVKRGSLPEDHPDFDQKYRDFHDAAMQARANAEANAVIGITEQGPEDWRAFAWFLERSFPRKYGRLQTTQITGGEGGPITLAGLADLMGVGDEDEADDNGD